MRDGCQDQRGMCQERGRGYFLAGPRKPGKEDGMYIGIGTLLVIIILIILLT